MPCSIHDQSQRDSILYRFIVFSLTACLVSLPAVLSGAEFDGRPYLGIQYAVADISVGPQSDGFSPTTLVARAGRYFRNNFSAEGRLAFPLSDDSQATPAGELSVGLFGILGGYGTAQVTFGERFTLYGIAGISMVAGEVDLAGSDQSDTETGLSYGAGLDFAFGSSALNLEYMSYLDKSGFDFDALAFGLKILF